MGALKPIDIPVAEGVIVTGTTVYRGFSMRETAGAPAVVRIRDAVTADTGKILEEISLAANESARECYDDESGIEAVTGVFFNLISGTIPVGSIRVG